MRTLVACMLALEHVYKVNPPDREKIAMVDRKDLNDKKKASDAKIQKLLDAASRDKELCEELLQAGEFDKPGYNARMKECHDQNALMLEGFLEKYGWPLPAEYGKKAHKAAWFIAIHAIAHPDLIKKVARILETALKNDQLPGKYYANFYDRIELYEGRQQKYGTHLYPSKVGWQAWNLENPETVNERRKVMGLSTLEDWIKESEDLSTGFKDYDEKFHEDEFVKWCKEVGWRK